MKTNRKIQNAPAPRTNWVTDALAYAGNLPAKTSALALYAILVTFLAFFSVFGYLRLTIDHIQVSSSLRNLQRANESMVRTCGGYPDPAYVCYGAANKAKLEELLDGPIGE